MKQIVERFCRALAFAALLGLVFGCSNRPKPTAEPVDDDPTATETGVTEEDPRGANADQEDRILSENIKDVFFDYDKYELRSDSRGVLQQNAKYLKEHPQTRLVLEGHCDERGTNEYNLALGQRRADAVKSYLIDLGVSGSNLTTISYGEERPFDSSGNESAWSLNRRVHFKID